MLPPINPAHVRKLSDDRRADPKRVQLSTRDGQAREVDTDPALDGKIELPKLPEWSHKKPKVRGFYLHNDGQVTTPVEVRSRRDGRMIVLFPGSEEEYLLARFARADKWRPLDVS